MEISGTTGARTGFGVATTVGRFLMGVTGPRLSSACAAATTVSGCEIASSSPGGVTAASSVAAGVSST